MHLMASLAHIRSDVSTAREQYFVRARCPQISELAYRMLTKSRSYCGVIWPQEGVCVKLVTKRAGHCSHALQSKAHKGWNKHHSGGLHCTLPSQGGQKHLCQRAPCCAAGLSASCAPAASRCPCLLRLQTWHCPAPRRTDSCQPCFKLDMVFTPCHASLCGSVACCCEKSFGTEEPSLPPSTLETVFSPEL